jgi:hypothetical protein
MLISIQDGVFMGFMNILLRAWRKQVVVQDEKNGNDAALRVRKQRITLLKSAKSHRIFSKPISIRARSSSGRVVLVSAAAAAKVIVLRAKTSGTRTRAIFISFC